MGITAAELSEVWEPRGRRTPKVGGSKSPEAKSFLRFATGYLYSTRPIKQTHRLKGASPTSAKYRGEYHRGYMGSVLSSRCAVHGGRKREKRREPGYLSSLSEVIHNWRFPNNNRIAQ